MNLSSKRVMDTGSTLRRLVVVSASASVLTIVAACGSTTFDESIAPTSQVTVPFTVPTGTTPELLQSLATSLNDLSGLIGPDSSGRTPEGKNELITVIESLWEAVRTDVTATDPDAADALGRMVALARTAVERSRPADADKAARFAGQVIDAYLTSL